MNDTNSKQLPLRQLLIRAAQVVHAVIYQGQNLNRVLAQQAPAGHAAVQDMAYRCLRDYGRLCAVRDAVLDQALRDEQVAVLLLVALQQLSVRTDQAHMVVNEATEAAAKLRVWARGLTNAVLRNALRRELLNAAWEDPVARWNYPLWWIEAVRVAYPQQWQAVLGAGNQHPPLVLRVNTRRISAIDYVLQLTTAGIAARLLENEAVRIEHALPVQRLPGFVEGWFSVQDAGAQKAARWLDAQAGQRVLDACCAPGGKTAHVLELIDVDLTALDVDAQRLQRVEENLARLGLIAHCVAGDAGKPDSWWDGREFDRILADVPCSASGVVRRHPDIKWLRRAEDIAGFARQQAVILDALWSCLAIGGKMLYVTCSIFPEENQQQIDSLLKRHDNARQLGLGADTLTGQLLPCEEYDGFFYALVEKI